MSLTSVSKKCKQLVFTVYSACRTGDLLLLLLFLIPVFQQLVILPLHFPNVFTSSVAYYRLDRRPCTMRWHTDEWDAVTYDLWAAPLSSIRMCLTRKLFWSVKKLLFAQITFIIMFAFFIHFWFFRKFLLTCVLPSTGYYGLPECRNLWYTELRGRDTCVKWLYILDVRDLHR